MTRVLGSHDEGDVSLMADDQYFRCVRQIAPLSLEEEAVMLERVARGRREQFTECPDAMVLAEAKAARDRLVEGFQPLVIALAEKAVRRFHSLTLLDVIQEGNVGLLEAIRDHDPMLGCPLVGLASVCIRHAISKAWCQQEGYIKLQTHEVGLLVAIEQANRQLGEQLGRAPSVTEVAQAVGLTEYRVQSLLAAQRTWRGESIQAMAERYELDEDKMALVSMFARAEATATSAQRCAQVRQAVDTYLGTVQRQVIGVRFGLDDGGQGCSQRETVKRVGGTLKSVQDAERKARRKLARVLCSDEGVSPVVCVECGSAMAYRAGRKFCSLRCQRVASRRRHREEVA